MATLTTRTFPQKAHKNLAQAIKMEYYRRRRRLCAPQYPNIADMGSAKRTIKTNKLFTSHLRVTKEAVAAGENERSSSYRKGEVEDNKTRGQCRINLIIPRKYANWCRFRVHWGSIGPMTGGDLCFEMGQSL